LALPKRFDCGDALTLLVFFLEQRPADARREVERRVDIEEDE
jgi:hypothetical protein